MLYINATDSFLCFLLLKCLCFLGLCFFLLLGTPDKEGCVAAGFLCVTILYPAKSNPKLPTPIATGLIHFLFLSQKPSGLLSSTSSFSLPLLLLLPLMFESSDASSSPPPPLLLPPPPEEPELLLLVVTFPPPPSSLDPLPSSDEPPPPSSLPPPSPPEPSPSFPFLERCYRHFLVRQQ